MLPIMLLTFLVTVTSLVQAFPHSLQALPMPSIEERKNGQSVTLTCKIITFSPVHMFWKKCDQYLTDDENHQILWANYSDRQVSELTIHNIGDETEGVITCVVHNYTNAELSVTYYIHHKEPQSFEWTFIKDLAFALLAVICIATCGYYIYKMAETRKRLEDLKEKQRHQIIQNL